MTVRRKLIPIVLVCSSPLWSSNAYSQLLLGDTIGIDFGTIAPAVGVNFNQFDANANPIANGATLAFNAQIGAPAELINTVGNSVAGVGFTVENQSGQSTDRANVTNGTIGPSPFDDSTIFNDVMISNDQSAARLNTGGFLVLTFTGLDDSLAYDLTGGMGPVNNNFNTTWTVGGISMLSNADNGYNSFLNLSTDGSGNLVITLTRSTHVNVAALTLTAITPEAALDSDNDGIADNFEESFFPGDLTQLNGLAAGPGPGAGTGDFDGDGLTDLEEFNLAVTDAIFPTLDPTDDDSDGDNLLDGVEDGAGTYVSAIQTGTSPVNSDSDGDDLLDGVETNTGSFVGNDDTGTNPNLVDTDGDTFSDGFEVSNGGDPTDINSLPDISAGYEAVGGNWLSATDFGSVDIDGDGLGSDGYLFFGDFTGVEDDNLTFADRSESLPSYVTTVTQGSDFVRVSSGFTGYGMIDNPNTLDGSDMIAGFALTDVEGFGNREILNFEVSGLTLGQMVRVGVLAGIHDADIGFFDPRSIILETPDGTNLQRENLGADPGLVNAGWVFFDVAQEGTYVVITDRRTSGGVGGSGIGGVTFDSIVDTTGLVAPDLMIDSDPANAANVLLAWEGTQGFTYGIISTTDLSLPLSSWTTVLSDITADANETIVESFPRPSAETTFYRLIQQ